MDQLELIWLGGLTAWMVWQAFKPVKVEAPPSDVTPVQLPPPKPVEPASEPVQPAPEPPPPIYPTDPAVLIGGPTGKDVYMRVRMRTSTPPGLVRPHGASDGEFYRSTGAKDVAGRWVYKIG